MNITPRYSNLPHTPSALPLPVETQPTPLPSFFAQQFDRSGTEPLAPPLANSQSSTTSASAGKSDLKDAFNDFVGQTFFGEMIKAFRSSQQPSKYFHGGRAEEIFQGQFDQVLSESLSESSAEQIANPMYELFMLKRGA